MPKDKKKAAQKKRQKAALKAARRRAEGKKHRPTAPKPVQVTEDMFPDQDYAFWLGHGVNCLASDYDQGLWTPLMEEVYDQQVSLTPAKIRRKVSSHLGAQAEAEWGDVHKAILAWALQDRNVVWAYRLEALRRVRVENPEGDADVLARSPMSGVTWAMFHDLVLGQALRDE